MSMINIKVRDSYSGMAVAAGFLLALAFTVSCSSDDGSDDGSLTDTRDGKNYKTVQIGSQIWMAENLNYHISNSLCYDDFESNCNVYGRLYDLLYVWNMVAWNMVQIVCPSGWHLPSKDEWAVLKGYVGESVEELTARSSFSALLGGIYGILNYKADGLEEIIGPVFSGVGYVGCWLASDGIELIENRRDGDSGSSDYTIRISHCSVRCVKD